MTSRSRRPFTSLSTAVVTTCFLLLVAASPGAAAPWQAWASPAAAGFDAAALDAVHAAADELGSGAVMAVYRGKVVLASGDVERPFMAHSVRKSLVSALYGIAVENGEIDLAATLADLGIDDEAALTAGERQATVGNLLAARSGVFLPAAYAPSDQDEERPERGSHQPGTHWMYNNWDFNVAGVIYEQRTDSDLYEAFDRRIARPIGMEDYSPAAAFRVYEPSLSRHPAHTFRISARDLARVGQLYLDGGRWGGRQVVPEAWVRASTRPVTDFGNGRGYGLMWWTYAAGSSRESYPHLSAYDVYAALGTGGQLLLVIPRAEMVFVHRGDTDHGREIRGAEAWKMAEAILAARRGEPAAAEEGEARFGPVAPQPFASQLPAPAPVREVELSPAAWAELHGEYEIAPGAVIRVFEWQGRHFGFMPGQGEAELFPLGEDRFTIRIVGGVEGRFERAADGTVDAVVFKMGPQTVRAAKRRPAEGEGEPSG